MRDQMVFSLDVVVAPLLIPEEAKKRGQHFFADLGLVPGRVHRET